MFAPTKIWRKWHRKINLNQKRFALCSALAASALPSLVLARGHRIEQVAEIPLVISNESFVDVTKTKHAVALLKSIHVDVDVDKVTNSRKIRRGKGKMRNRRRVQRRGPLIIYAKKGPLIAAFRNIPGVELVCVDRLNLLQLAPGGHLGRFCIWLKDAFERLDALYGSYKKPSKEKRDFRLPRPLMANPDLGRVINSDEIQTRLRPIIKQRAFHVRKKNPLKNLGFLIKLNPYAKVQRRRQILTEKARAIKKEAILKEKRAQLKKDKVLKKSRKPLYAKLMANTRMYEGLDKKVEPKH
jgi:large subunit ribosomal protein L4e